MLLLKMSEINFKNLQELAAPKNMQRIFCCFYKKNRGFKIFRFFAKKISELKIFFIGLNAGWPGPASSVEEHSLLKNFRPNLAKDYFSDAIK